MDLTLKHPRTSRIRANLILSVGSKKERKDVCAWYSVNEEWTAKKEVKKMRKIAAISVLVVLLGITGTAAGQIIYVDADANGLNNGSSWTDAYNYLQDALAAASSGDEIWVAEGIYKPDQGIGITPGDRDATFQLINGVSIKGGYAGYGQPDPNARDVHAYETILSGDLDGNDIDVNDLWDLWNEPTRDENSYHVVTGYQTDTMDATTDLLDGFTISGGNANDSSYPNKYGGGMFCNSDATLVNCTFTGNSARKGGGILCGASWCCATYPTVTNCTFIGNSAEDAGGMFISDSDPVLTNCVFIGNSASNDGGAVMYYMDSIPILNNCLFSGNQAAHDGGGIFLLFAFNINITNSTFGYNSAGNLGGGIYQSDASTTPQINNCILWGNSPSQISQDDEVTASITYSDVQGGWPGEGNIDADPCFVEAGYWGDANDPNIIVETNDANAVWVEGDYHLKSEGLRWNAKWKEWDFDRVTSPCIDAGNPGCPLGDELLTVPDDPYNEWGENLRINMGSYGGTAEASMPPYDWAILADLTNDGIVNLKDFAGQAQYWMITKSKQPGDLNRDGTVNMTDLALFVQDWLIETSWH